MMTMLTIWKIQMVWCKAPAHSSQTHPVNTISAEGIYQQIKTILRYLCRERHRFCFPVDITDSVSHWLTDLLIPTIEDGTWPHLMGWLLRSASNPMIKWLWLHEPAILIILCLPKAGEVRAWRRFLKQKPPKSFANRSLTSLINCLQILISPSQTCCAFWNLFDLGLFQILTRYILEINLFKCQQKRPKTTPVSFLATAKKI